MAITESLDAATQQVLSLLAQLKLSNVRILQGQDVGSVNTVLVKTTPALASYGADVLIIADIAFANTIAAPKISVSDLGQISIVSADGTPVGIGAVAGKCLFGISTASGGGYVARLLSPLSAAQIIALIAANTTPNAFPNLVKITSIPNVYTKAVIGGLFGLMEGQAGVTCSGAPYFDLPLPEAFSTDEKWTIIAKDTNSDGSPGPGVDITGHPITGGIVRLFPRNADGSIYAGPLSFKYDCMGHQ